MNQSNQNSFDLSISLVNNKYLIQVGGNNLDYWTRQIKRLSESIQYDNQLQGWIVPVENSTNEKLNLILYLTKSNTLFRNDVITLSYDVKNLLKLTN